jgi:hypothetical protein
LAIVKDALIAKILALALAKHWTIGTKSDPSNQYRTLFSDVLYIDTPVGQVSFHVKKNAYPDLPRYAGEWSGRRNTENILCVLFEERFEALAA